MEDASAASGQKYMCAIRGTAAGGGYELALATDHILLADDGNSTVALPELPLLAVLPGTGGLTRVTDKRKVRRDLADAFCTVEEGVKGARAVKWRLVDQVGAQLQVRAGGEGRGQEARRPVRPAGRRQGHRADADRAHDRRRRRHLLEREGRDRRATRGAPRSPSWARARRRRLRPKPWSRRAPRSGRCGWRASSTTPSCICASTSPRSAC